MAAEEEDVPRFACPKIDKSFDDLLPRICGHVPKLLLINLKEQEVDAEAQFDRVKYLEKPDDELQDLTLRVLLLGGSVKTQPENDYEEHIPIIYVTNCRKYNGLAFRAWQEAELRAGRKRDAFHENFIWDIFATGKIGDLKDYRIGASFFEPYDEKEILSANLNWTKLKLLAPVDSDSSGDSDGDYKISSRKLTRRRKSRRVSPISSEEGSVLSLRSSRTRSRSPINLPDSPGTVRRRNRRPPISPRSVDSPGRNTGSSSIGSQCPRGSSPESSRADPGTPRRNIEDSSTAAQYSPGSSRESSRNVPGGTRSVATQYSPPKAPQASSPPGNVTASSEGAHHSRGNTPGSPPQRSSNVNVAGGTGSGSNRIPSPGASPRPRSPPRVDVNQPRITPGPGPPGSPFRVDANQPRMTPSPPPMPPPVPLAAQHTNRGGAPPGPKKPPISFAEQRMLLNYVIQRNEYRRLKSKSLYIEMEHDRVIPHERTWQTLMGHFKKTLLRRQVIGQHNLGTVAMINFREYLKD